MRTEESPDALEQLVASVMGDDVRRAAAPDLRGLTLERLKRRRRRRSTLILGGTLGVVLLAVMTTLTVDFGSDDEPRVVMTAPPVDGPTVGAPQTETPPVEEPTATAPEPDAPAIELPADFPDALRFVFDATGVPISSIVEPAFREGVTQVRFVEDLGEERMMAVIAALEEAGYVDFFIDDCAGSPGDRGLGYPCGVVASGDGLRVRVYENDVPPPDPGYIEYEPLAEPGEPG